MPWTPEEAKSHTKNANTPKKKRQWAHVANGVLKKTKNEKKAIMAANAAVAGDEMTDVELNDWMIDSDVAQPWAPPVYPEKKS